MVEYYCMNSRRLREGKGNIFAYPAVNCYNNYLNTIEHKATERREEGYLRPSRG